MSTSWQTSRRSPSRRSQGLGSGSGVSAGRPASIAGWKLGSRTASTLRSHLHTAVLQSALHRLGGCHTSLAHPAWSQRLRVHAQGHRLSPLRHLIWDLHQAFCLQPQVRVSKPVIESQHSQARISREEIAGLVIRSDQRSARTTQPPSGPGSGSAGSRCSSGATAARRRAPWC